MKKEEELQLEKRDNTISNADELHSLQSNLINAKDSNYIKLELPLNAKFTKRRLTRKMCLCLVFIYKHYRYSENVCETDYFPKKVLLQYLINFPQITSSFNDLLYWDLITPMPTSSSEVKYKKGWYGITENSIKFIQKEIGLPKYAFVYNKKAYEHQTNPYYIITDLINNEDLNELLKP
jgi:hypothetical protein